MTRHTEPARHSLHDDFAAESAAARQRLDLADQEPIAVEPPDEAESEADENVFQVLARQARTRTPRELGLTTLGGVLNAVLIGWQHPALSWLAAGCAAAAAYGAWGLLDRAAQTSMSSEEACADTVRQLLGVRDLTAVLGGGAALWAVLDFMAAALGNWHH